MKSRFVRFGVLIVSVMGLLVTSTPAEAIWVKNVTLNGNATLFNCRDTTTGAPSPGLSDPTWTTGTTTTNEVPDVKTETKTGPKSEPEVNTTVLNGNTCDFNFSADCVKESVGKKNGVDTCVINAVGTITGFCDLTSGRMTAVLINTSNTIRLKPDVVADFKFSWTNTTLRMSGGDDMQNIHGVASVTPNLVPGAGSCTNKTATSFLIHGYVVIKKIT